MASPRMAIRDRPMVAIDRSTILTRGRRGRPRRRTGPAFTEPRPGPDGTEQRVVTPEQFFGFRMGADNKLARWDKIVEYMRLVAGGSDRVRVRDLGKSTNDNPFIALEISSPDTHARISITTSRSNGSSIFATARQATPSATRSSGTARSFCSSRAAFTRRRSAPRRWPWTSSTAWRPTTHRR